MQHESTTTIKWNYEWLIHQWSIRPYTSWLYMHGEGKPVNSLSTKFAELLLITMPRPSHNTVLFKIPVSINTRPVLKRLHAGPLQENWDNQYPSLSFNTIVYIFQKSLQSSFVPTIIVYLWLDSLMEVKPEMAQYTEHESTHKWHNEWFLHQP